MANNSSHESLQLLAAAVPPTDRIGQPEFAGLAAFCDGLPKAALDKRRFSLSNSFPASHHLRVAL
jgi:hypothetical protein